MDRGRKCLANNTDKEQQNRVWIPWHTFRSITTVLHHSSLAVLHSPPTIKYLLIKVSSVTLYPLPLSNNDNQCVGTNWQPHKSGVKSKFCQFGFWASYNFFEAQLPHPVKWGIKNLPCELLWRLEIKHGKPPAQCSAYSWHVIECSYFLALCLHMLFALPRMLLCPPLHWDTTNQDPGLILYLMQSLPFLPYVIGGFLLS